MVISEIEFLIYRSSYDDFGDSKILKGFRNSTRGIRKQLPLLQLLRILVLKVEALLHNVTRTTFWDVMGL